MHVVRSTSSKRCLRWLPIRSLTIAGTCRMAAVLIAIILPGAISACWRAGSSSVAAIRLWLVIGRPLTRPTHVCGCARPTA